MSLDAILWALKDAPVKDSEERLVLISLAEAADPDGCDAYPSKKTISEEAMVDPKTVQRRLAALLKRGLIVKGDQRAAYRIPAHLRPTVYDLQIPYGWYGEDRIGRVNGFRAGRGRAPLTPEMRPGLGEAPERSKRADAGKKRTPKAPGKDQAPEEGGTASPPSGGGDYESPQDYETPQGGTASPQRGDYKTPKPVLEPALVTSPIETPPSAVGDDVQVVRGGQGDAGGHGEGSPAASAQAPAAAGRKDSSIDGGDGTAGRTGTGKPGSGRERRLPADGRQASVEVLRSAFHVLHSLPAPVVEGLSEGQQRAVVEHIRVELEHRTPAQLLERARRNWLAFEGQTVRDRVAVCVRLVHRGLDCSDSRCEDGLLVDDGQPCGACALSAEGVVHARNNPRSAEEFEFVVEDVEVPIEVFETYQALPVDWRKGAQDWVAHQMMQRVADLLGDGYSRAQILTVARDVPAQGRRGHLTRMLLLATSLRSARREGTLPENCPDCGQKPFASGRCGCPSTMVAETDEEFLAQLERVQAALGA